jgi:hypothetical protein
LFIEKAGAIDGNQKPSDDRKVSGWHCVFDRKHPVGFPAPTSFEKSGSFTTLSLATDQSLTP